MRGRSLVPGAVEVVLYVEPGLEMGMGTQGAIRVWAVLLTSGISLMVWGGMKLVSRLGLFFAAVVGTVWTGDRGGGCEERGGGNDSGDLCAPHRSHCSVHVSLYSLHD